MEKLLKRHSELIDMIGHERLLDLPEQVKEVLKGNYDLQTKVKMFEAVANALGIEE